MQIEQKNQEERKKFIFNSMGKRGQKQILKKGYDIWNPFQEPKDPIDLREDKTKRTAHELLQTFLQDVDPKKYNKAYSKGAFDMCLGIMNEKENFFGMYDFACWYQKELKKKGVGSLQ